MISNDIHLYFYMMISTPGPLYLLPVFTPMIRSSPVTKVWRLRVYNNEKIVGAAKPLFFVKGRLGLTAGQCKRIL